MCLAFDMNIDIKLAIFLTSSDLIGGIILSQCEVNTHYYVILTGNYRSHIIFYFALGTIGMPVTEYDSWI